MLHAESAFAFEAQVAIFDEVIRNWDGKGCCVAALFV